MIVEDKYGKPNYISDRAITYAELDASIIVVTEEGVEDPPVIISGVIIHLNCYDLVRDENNQIKSIPAQIELIGECAENFRKSYGVSPHAGIDFRKDWQL